VVLGQVKVDVLDVLRCYTSQSTSLLCPRGRQRGFQPAQCVRKVGCELPSGLGQRDAPAGADEVGRRESVLEERSYIVGLGAT